MRIKVRTIYAKVSIWRHWSGGRAHITDQGREKFKFSESQYEKMGRWGEWAMRNKRVGCQIIRRSNKRGGGAYKFRGVSLSGNSLEFSKSSRMSDKN